MVKKLVKSYQRCYRVCGDNVSLDVENLPRSISTLWVMWDQVCVCTGTPIYWGFSPYDRESLWLDFALEHVHGY